LKDYALYNSSNALATYLTNEDLRSLGINISSSHRIVSFHSKLKLIITNDLKKKYATIHHNNLQIELALAVFKDSTYHQTYKISYSNSSNSENILEEFILSSPNNSRIVK
jgi:hypothetical protein